MKWMLSFFLIILTSHLLAQTQYPAFKCYQELCQAYIVEQTKVELEIDSTDINVLSNTAPLVKKARELVDLKIGENAQAVIKKYQDYYKKLNIDYPQCISGLVQKYAGNVKKTCHKEIVVSHYKTPTSKQLIDFLDAKEKSMDLFLYSYFKNDPTSLATILQKSKAGYFQGIMELNYLDFWLKVAPYMFNVKDEIDESMNELLKDKDICEKYPKKFQEFSEYDTSCRLLSLHANRIDDRTDSIDGKIIVSTSLQTIRLGSGGVFIYFHELAHALSQNGKNNDTRRSCVDSALDLKSIIPKGKGLEFYLEETYADIVANIATKSGGSMAHCSLAPHDLLNASACKQENGPLATEGEEMFKALNRQLISLPNPDDPHLPSLVRSILMISLSNQIKLPSACQEHLDSLGIKMDIQKISACMK